MRLILIGAVILLAIATWINEIAIADAMFIFAAFALGGLWSKHGAGNDTDS